MSTVMGSVPAAVPGRHPLPSGILGVLYETPAAPERAEVVSIEKMAGRAHRLYVALRDAQGHEILDVWDTRDPARCMLLDSIDFGHVATNRVQFIPLALIPFAEGLLLQTESGLTVYRHAADDRLTPIRSMPHFGTHLGSGLQQIHHYGNYGSVYQQVISDRDIDGFNLDQIHRHVLLDLARPEQPSLFWLGHDGPKTLSETPVNAAYQGNPASLTFSPEANTGQLTVWEPSLGEHVNEYWMPKIDAFFVEKALTTSLRDLVTATVGALDLPALQAAAIVSYGNHVAFGGTNLSSWIHRHHTDGERLIDVMAGYGISPDDTLEFALARLFERGFDLELERSVSRTLYAPALQQWLETIVRMQAGWETLQDVHAHLATLFNADLDSGSLIEYLTLKVVSPLIGNPGFMRMTLQDLIDEIVASPVAEVIDLLLSTAGGFGALNAVLDSIDSMLALIDAIPGVSVPRLPAGARFPDSTATLIDQALFSWNREGTADLLDPAGLAWFELLKFYRYLSSAELGFMEYLYELDAIIREMQATLGAELFGKLSGAFEGVTDVMEQLDALHASFASELKSRFSISALLAIQLVGAIDIAGELDARQPVSEALSRWGLRVDQLGFPESTIADLETALRDRALDGLDLDQIPIAAAAADVEALQRQIEQVIRTRIQVAFGVNDPDLTLMDALLPYLTQQVALNETFGEHLSAILNNMLFEGTAMGQLLLTYRRAFEHDDVIAQWLVALDAVALATAWIDSGSAAMALEFCLSEAYDAGVSYLVEALYGMLIQEVVQSFLGDQSRWIAMKLKARSWAFNLDDPSPEYQVRTLGAFAWQQQVGFVQQKRLETNWFGPREITLHTFHPADPAATREVLDLGAWTHLNYVHHEDGALFLAGTFFTEGDGIFPSGKAMILDLAGRPVRRQILRGGAFLPLASAPLLASANHQAHLAVGGVNRVFLLPNPAVHSRSVDHALGAPRILVPPRPATAREGAPVRLEVAALGSAPLHYQWFKNGAIIADAATANLAWASVATIDAGDYHVIVSNAAGSAASTAIALHIKPASTLSITSSPVSRFGFTGQTITFSVGVQADRPVNFQWYHNGLAITGSNGTAATLSVGPLTVSDAGFYGVMVSDGLIEERSAPARLVVIDAPPPRVLSMPSVRERLQVGMSNALTVAAGGYAPLAFEWFHNGVPLDEVDGPSLNLSSVTREAAGAYAVRITDASGSSITVEFQVQLLGSLKLKVAPDAQGELLIYLEDGQPGESYTLQQSHDLTEWTRLDEGVYPGGGGVILNVGAPQPVPAFYRVRIDP